MLFEKKKKTGKSFKNIFVCLDKRDTIIVFRRMFFSSDFSKFEWFFWKIWSHHEHILFWKKTPKTVIGVLVCVGKNQGIQFSPTCFWFCNNHYRKSTFLKKMIAWTYSFLEKNTKNCHWSARLCWEKQRKSGFPHMFLVLQQSL